MSAQGHFSAGYQSFPLVGPECFRDLKKDAGQADMTKMQPKILNIFRFLQINRILCQVSDIVLSIILGKKYVGTPRSILSSRIQSRSSTMPCLVQIMNNLEGTMIWS